MVDAVQQAQAPAAPAPSQISMTTLAILVFAALVVTVSSTIFLMNRETSYGGATGFAVTDSGNVTLTINSSLNIQVDTTNNTIAFGTCTPRGGSTYYCASNDSISCNNVSLSLGNCTGDTNATQFIRVLNVGNVNASVNVSTSCTAAQLIGGTAPLFQYTTQGCDGGTTSNIVPWQPLSTVAAGTMACNRTMVGGTGFRLYANVTIPNDANPAGCAGGTAVLQFSAILAS